MTRPRTSRDDESPVGRWLLPAGILVLVAGPCLLLGGAPPALRTAVVMAALVAAWAVSLRKLLRGHPFPLPAEAVALAAAAAFTFLQALPLGPGPASLLGGPSILRANEVLRAVGVDAPWRSLSTEVPATLAEGARLWAWALVLAAFVAVARHRRPRRAILVAVALQGAIQGLAGLVALAPGWDLRTAFVDNPALLRPGFHGLLLNDNHAAGAFNLAAFAFVGLAFEIPGRRRVLPVIGALAMAACTLAVGSRAGSTVLVLTSLVLLAWLRWLAPVDAAPARPTAVRVLLAVGVLAATALAFVAVDEWSFRRVDESRLVEAVSGKTRIWGPTLEMIGDHPLAGVGRGAFPVAATAYNDTDPARTYEYVENAPLQALADWGVPAGLAAVGAFLFFLARLLLALSDRRGLLAAMFGVVAVAVQNLADFSLEVPGVALPVLAVLGAAIAHRLRTASSRGPAFRRIPPAAALAVTSLSLALALPLAWADGHALGTARNDVESLARRVLGGEAAPVDEADAVVHDAVSMHPLDAHLLDVGARIALVQRRFDRAADLADAALLLFPRSATAAVARAQADRARGRMDDADRRLAGLLATRPDVERSTFAFLQASGWPAADVVTILAERPGGLDRYLDSLARGRRSDDAVGILRARLAEAPEDRNALSRLGGLLLRTGDLPGADDVAVRLVGAHPAAPDGWLLMGRVAQARDQHLEAFTLFQEAAALGPDSTDANLGALRSLLFLGREEEFEALEKRLEAKVGPSISARAELLRLQASHHARMGRYAAALEALDRAERLIPRDVSVRVARAFVRLQAGDREGALRELRQALSLEPSHAEARRALEALEAVSPTAPASP